jgi:hypothetical protein
MQAVVEQQGLVAFTAATASNGWQAPIIPSAWYIAHTCPLGQKPSAQAARDLGLALSRAIDVWAPTMRTDAVGEALFAKATTLVDLAYWLGTAEGYGNFILSYRARDVAVIGLGRLVADLNYPLAGPAAQVRRCRVPFETPAARARVLNYEVGAPLFPTAADVSLDTLRDVWFKSALRRSFADQPLPTPGGPMDGSQTLATLRQQRDQVVAMGVDLDHPDPYGSFFKDDPASPPLTTTNEWNRKAHGGVIGQDIPQHLPGVERLVIFRETIGYFPQTPSARQSEILSELEEAFAEAWQPHLLESAPVDIGASAGKTYERIKQGTMFMDQDAALVYSELARTPGALPLGTATTPPVPTPSAGTPTQ